MASARAIRLVVAPFTEVSGGRKTKVAYLTLDAPASMNVSVTQGKGRTTREEAREGGGGPAPIGEILPAVGIFSPIGPLWTTSLHEGFVLDRKVATPRPIVFLFVTARSHGT